MLRDVLILVALALVLAAVLSARPSRSEEYGVPCEDIWHWPYKGFVGHDDCSWRALC